MKLTADQNCYLTEVEDVSIENRTFRDMVVISNENDIAKWRQATNEERVATLKMQNLLKSQNIDTEYLSTMEVLIDGIKRKVNNANLTNEEAIKYKDFFPTFESLIGQEIDLGFKFNYENDLFEALVRHEVSEDNKPTKIMLLSNSDTNTQTLYKLVTI